MTRLSLPTRRAHYPGGSDRCICRWLPSPCCLPRPCGGSASALKLSRPAQASLTLRLAGSLGCPKATFVTRLRSGQSPSRTARQLPDPSTLIRVEPSSTRETRLQGARREKYRVTASASVIL